MDALAERLITLKALTELGKPAHHLGNDPIFGGDNLKKVFRRLPHKVSFVLSIPSHVYLLIFEAERWYS